MVRMSSWSTLGASVRGASHEENGKPNQDAVRLNTPCGKSNCVIISVSDGHGNARSFRSGQGAALGAECAQRVLRDFVRKLGPNPPFSVVRRQVQNLWPLAMIAAWKKAVRDDLAAHPFSPMDFAAFPEKPPKIKPGKDLPPAAYLAYGATLVAVVVTPRYFIYSQLGDGDILAVHADGRVVRPLPRQHEFMANQTESLCTQKAHRLFQVRVEPCRADSPVLVSVSTDGYANCFRTDEGFFKVGADLLTYLRLEGIDFVEQQLENWLRESSHDGSGDDISVGMAVRRRVAGREDQS